MRVLVAITCLAVLAAIGYFFWSEYRESEQRKAAQIARGEQVIREEMQKEAARLASAGRCTALAKAVTDSQGKLPSADLPDARICYQYGDLTAFERNSFELYPDALK